MAQSSPEGRSTRASALYGILEPHQPEQPAATPSQPRAEIDQSSYANQHSCYARWMRWQTDTKSATTKTPNDMKCNVINAWRRASHSHLPAMARRDGDHPTFYGLHRVRPIYHRGPIRGVRAGQPVPWDGSGINNIQPITSLFRLSMLWVSPPTHTTLWWSCWRCRGQNGRDGKRGTIKEYPR
jgi:hypothetical protein